MGAREKKRDCDAFSSKAVPESFSYNAFHHHPPSPLSAVGNVGLLASILKSALVLQFRLHIFPTHPHH